MCVHPCVCVLLCTRVWLNTGQDSISVFGHGAGSVAVREYPGSLRPCNGKESSDGHSDSHTPLQTPQFFSVLLLSTSRLSSIPSISPFQAFQSLCFHGSHIETRMCGWQPKYHESVFVFSCSPSTNNNKQEWRLSYPTLSPIRQISRWFMSKINSLLQNYPLFSIPPVSSTSLPVGLIDQDTNHCVTEEIFLKLTQCWWLL